MPGREKEDQGEGPAVRGGTGASAVNIDWIQQLEHDGLVPCIDHLTALCRITDGA